MQVFEPGCGRVEGGTLMWTVSTEAHPITLQLRAASVREADTESSNAHRG